MEGLAVGLAAAGFVLFWGWQVQLTLRTHRDRRRAWSQALEEASVKRLIDESGRMSRVALAGEVAGRSIRIEQYNRSKGERGVSITIAGSSDLGLRREWFGTALEKAFGSREIQLGDQEFDKAVLIEGPPEQVRALLDAETRSLILAFIEGRLQTSDGWGLEAWTAVREGNVVAEFNRYAESRLLANFTATLGVLLDVARRLDRPADLVGRIVENLRREPLAPVRLRSIQLLASDYPDRAASREAFRHACGDGNAEVRLRAAAALGEEGQDVLLEIAMNQAANESRAARALSGLGRNLPLERGLEILGDALRKRRIETARACIESLGQVGGDGVVGPLAKVLAVEDGPLAVAAAQALGASGSPAAEAPLLKALAASGAAAAAEALGHVGTAAAVLPLKEAAHAPAGNSALRRAARQAVAEIQSRLQGASPGQVSLAEGETGQLSLSEDPAGRVSVVKPDGDA